jgi:hypothetical protein
MIHENTKDQTDPYSSAASLVPFEFLLDQQNWTE